MNQDDFFYYQDKIHNRSPNKLRNLGSSKPLQAPCGSSLLSALGKCEEQKSYQETFETKKCTRLKGEITLIPKSPNIIFRNNLNFITWASY